MSEEAINELLDRFINGYLRVVGPIADDARDLALQRIEKFLRESAESNFKSADQFAERLFEEITEAYAATWESERAQRAVKRTARDIYTYYRLRDNSIFGGDDPPVKMRFGGPDTRAVNFFGRFDSFYFSKYVDNSERGLRDFLRQEYLDKGAALFGRGTPEELEDFRKAAGGKLDQVNDYGVETIVRSGVQRIRNYAHINSLRQARFNLMKIVAILDSATSPICRYLNGKLIRVGVAASTVDRLVKMEPGEYAKELYYSDNGKAYSRDPVGYVTGRITEDVLDDGLVKEGLGFPPFHPRCRTRVQGVFENLGEQPPSTPAPEEELEEIPDTGADARKRLEQIEDKYVGQVIAADKLREQKLAEWREADTAGQRRKAKKLDREIAAIDREEGPRKERRDEAMRRALFASSPVNFNVDYDPNIDPDVKKVVERGVEYFRNFAGGDVLEGKTIKVFEAPRGRAYYDNGSIHISKGDEPHVVCHELGHWLEQSDDEILKKIVDLHGKRTANDAPEFLSTLLPNDGYDPLEVTKKDKYLHPYMGKTYPKGAFDPTIVATEILAKGVEHFYKDPLGLAEYDPEFFDLIYEVVRMKKKP